MACFTTLYSGSSGNCAFLEEDGRFLLVDLGKSARATTRALGQLGAQAKQLCGVLVTHEHTDHIAGLAVFLKKAPVPVYGTQATLEALARRGLVPPGTQLVPTDGRGELQAGGFGVQSFSTSHDSADCCGFRVRTPQGKTLAIATDLGYVSDEVLANLYLADMVALEANYDLHMLMHGPYPYYLKTRIASKKGHLCNEECAATLAKLMAAGCKRFSLCHISQENNAPALALQSVQAALLQSGTAPAPDAVVQAARRHEVSPVFEF